jgi:hypothetical protein
MRIGILTFHRAHNYGAVLQAYALQRVFVQSGAVVELIDYRQSHIESYYKSHYDFRFIVKCLYKFKVRTLFYHLRDNAHITKRCWYFYRFRSKYLNCSKHQYDETSMTNYDRYVIGSDQVWGIHCYGGYDKMYWGEIKRPINSKIYGYAISANGDYHDYITNEQLQKIVKGFDDISFREKYIADDIEESTGIRKRLCVDPTLLTGEKVWQPLIQVKWQHRKYIAIYDIRRDVRRKTFVEEKAEHLAKLVGIEIVDLSQMNFSVEDFVSCIRYAYCVFTTSFHATVFSILFQRPFYAFCLNDGHDGRYCNLLERLKLSHLIKNENSAIRGIEEWDYKKVDLELNKLRKESYEYICQILNA